MANPTTNIGMTKPTVGGSTDTWGTTINENVVDIIDALFSISGTDVTMSDIKFNSIGLQETGAGTDTVKIQAPSAVTQYTLTMPGAVGSANQVLSASDGSGTLAWTTPEVGDITSVADATNGGMTVTNGGGPAVTLALNFNDLSAAAVNVANDSIAIIDADDSNGTRKESIADLATAMGGTGLSGASGTLAVDASQTQITAVGTIATGVWNGTAITGAYIDPTSSPLANTKIWIGSASNVAAEFALSGDATMSAGGAVTVVAAPAGTLTGTTLKSTVVTSSLTAVGTIATGVWNGTAIANANLANSTVAYGGVTLALGASDATPAFNLSDATGYTGDSALVTTGTITSGTWQGTTVAVNKGGTGLASYAAGDIVYASGATTLAKLAKGSDTQVLTLASGVPTWAAPTVGDITAITAGTGLSGTNLTGPVPTLNVDASQTQITAVGTIATGVWNGTKVASAYLDDDTAHLSGTQTFSGAKTFSATLTVADELIVTGTGPSAIGSAADGRIATLLGGAYTSDGSGNLAVGTALQHALTGAAGDTGSLAIAHIRGNINTQSATESIGVVTSLKVDEPIIVDNLGGSGVVTVAASLYVTAAPTEGAKNAAIFVAAGDVMLPASGKLYLDGGGDTYLAEDGADEVKLFAGGALKMYLTGNTARFPGAYANTTGSAVNMHVTSDGDLARSTSSLRYKTDVVDYELERAQSLIAALEPITYRHKEESHHHLGFIAEAVHPHEPLLVVLNDDGEPEALEYDRLAVPLTAVVQGQMAEIAALTDRIAALEASASDGV